MNPRISFCHYSFKTNSPKILDADSIRPILVEALNKANCNIVSDSIHIFNNGGLTLLFILQESSCAVHTWPELSTFFITLETCGDNVDYQSFQDSIVSQTESILMNKTQGDLT